MKKVLVITYYWPRSGGAGVQRWLKFTKYLPEYGWEPVILTVKEECASYAQWDETLAKEINPSLKVIRTASFEPYSLYVRISGKKEIPYGGFTNEGNPTFFQKLSRFIRGNFFIPDPRRGWNRYAIKAAKKLMEEEKFVAIITTGPPHSTHLIGYQLKLITGIKWIADFRDPWTDIYYYKDLSHSMPAKWYDRKLEKKILDKWIEKGLDGNPIIPKDNDGNPVQGAVSLTDVNAFTQEMNDLMNIENTLTQETIKFEDLNLSTAKVKDLMKLDFLFN